jgi:hypothetical protein
MTEREFTQEEIAAFKQAEPQLAERGMFVAGAKGEANGAQFMRWFDLNPNVPMTVERLLWLFEEFKKKPKAIFFKSDAQMKFERAARGIPPADLDQLEKFLKANRLWPDDDGAYLNAVQFIGAMGGRPYTHEVLAHWALPHIQGTSRERLYWKTPSQDSTYRITGKHSGGDSHFAPKSESNQSFTDRVLNRSTEIPRPVSSTKMDEYQWNRLASSLCGERHSDTFVIQEAVKAAGGGEAGYQAGLAVQKRIRLERERGR